MYQPMKRHENMWPIVFVETYTLTHAERRSASSLVARRTDKQTDRQTTRPRDRERERGRETAQVDKDTESQRCRETGRQTESRVRFHFSHVADVAVGSFSSLCQDEPLSTERLRHFGAARLSYFAKSDDAPILHPCMHSLGHLNGVLAASIDPL